MDKVFVDSDVILDLLQKREPFYPHALALFTLVEEDKIRGHVSALIFANLYYILRKAGSGKSAIEILTRLKSLVKILEINDKIVTLALSSGFRDFEDAIQYYAALEANLQYLITRNKDDYKESRLIICTPREYLAIRDAGGGE